VDGMVLEDLFSDEKLISTAQPKSELALKYSPYFDILENLSGQDLNKIFEETN
jgi:hypothetical protein